MSKGDLVFLFVAIFVHVAGVFFGYQIATDDMRRAAIKSGHAEYVTDENGEPVWRMKEVKQ